MLIEKPNVQLSNQISIFDEIPGEKRQINFSGKFFTLIFAQWEGKELKVPPIFFGENTSNSNKDITFFKILTLF